MKILSLFDGMACGYEALVRAGIKIDKYYASEIDKYAIQIAQKNHPDIIQIGDVQKIGFSRDELGGGDMLYRLEDDGSIYLIDRGPIDLLIGGSPCQGFSAAGKKLNFDDPRSKLFFEYVRILKECQPRYFLLENVIMKKEWQDIISSALGVHPIEINSSLVSAQNRKRLYRTNIPCFSLPKDRGIRLKDILDHEESDLISYVDGELRIKQATEKGYLVAEEGDGIDLSYPTSKTRRGRVIKGKSNTLTANGELYVCDKIIRKLTVKERERLQTLREGYTEGVSENQRCKMIGNGWTVDVIAHIFSFMECNSH